MAKITVGYAADGSAKDYTTLAAAYAAAAAGDELEIWYSNANGGPCWGEPISSGNVTKAVSITGALPQRKVSFVNSGWFYWLSGDLSGNSSRVTVKNIAITDLAYLGYGIGWSDSGTGGAGITIEDCLFVGQGYGVLFGSGANGALIVRNCLFMACDYAMYVGTPICSVVGNTFVRCNNGVYGMNAWSGSVLKNNLVLNCKTPFADNYSWAYWVASHNVCDSATPPGTSGQLISRSTAKLACDAIGGFDLDARLQPTSPLIGAGVAHAAMSSTDIDGKTRGSPPAIGCSEGIGVYTDPGETAVLDGLQYMFAGELREGSLAVSAPTAAEVAAAVVAALTIPTPPTVEQIAAGITIPTPPSVGDISGGVIGASVGDGATTVSEALRIILAVAAGKSSGHPLAPVFRNLADSKDVVAGTLDADGNRSAVTVTP